jgi:hypothetical protein
MKEKNNKNEGKTGCVSQNSTSCSKNMHNKRKKRE